MSCHWSSGSDFSGVLAVTNPGGEEGFTEADFTLLQALAEQAALALHNAEFLHLQIERQQLDLDLSIASGIQQMLLPRENAQLAGLEIAAHYAPAQRVGGISTTSLRFRTRDSGW